MLGVLAISAHDVNARVSQRRRRSLLLLELHAVWIGVGHADRARSSALEHRHRVPGFDRALVSVGVFLSLNQVRLPVHGVPVRLALEIEMSVRALVRSILIENRRNERRPRADVRRCPVDCVARVSHQ
jgi:hypothetical protein